MQSMEVLNSRVPYSIFFGYFMTIKAGNPKCGEYRGIILVRSLPLELLSSFVGFYLCSGTGS